MIKNEINYPKKHILNVFYVTAGIQELNKKLVQIIIQISSYIGVHPAALLKKIVIIIMYFTVRFKLYIFQGFLLTFFRKGWVLA